MTVTLSIKQVPDDVAAALRERAAANRRSLQRELLTIVEQAASTSGWHGVAEPPPVYAPTSKPTHKTTRRPRAAKNPPRPSGRLGLEQLWERARSLGLPTGGDSTAAIVRRERDARNRR